jgi:hypothetical protein
MITVVDMKRIRNMMNKGKFPVNIIGMVACILVALISYVLLYSNAFKKGYSNEI